MWTIGGYADDQFHARQSAPLGGRRKRGEQKQAVGRSRGGRNTKIHALADAKGRLLAILLTGGQAHDYPVAKRLIRRVAPPKHMLGDTAYDGDGLREELDQRGTKPVIETTPTKAPAQLQQAPLQATLADRECVQTGPKTSGASPHDTTGWRATTWPPSASPPRSHGGFNESRP